MFARHCRFLKFHLEPSPVFLVFPLPQRDILDDCVNSIGYLRYFDGFFKLFLTTQNYTFDLV